MEDVTSATNTPLATVSYVLTGQLRLCHVGEFDLSVGSTMTVAMYVLVLALLAQIPSIVALILALMAAILLGLVNGLIVDLSLPTFERSLEK